MPTCRNRSRPITRKSAARAATVHPADTLTLYGPDDIRLRRTQIDEGLAPPERKSADHARLNALLGLAEACPAAARSCWVISARRRSPAAIAISATARRRSSTPPPPVQKALSAILRTGEWFGAGHLIDILTGTETDKVRARGHDRLPTFGVGTEFDRKGWQAVFRQMMGHDLVRPDPARHGALRLTEAARPILRGEDGITLRKDTLAKGGAAPPQRRWSRRRTRRFSRR
jgi:ATP-dependent DNA helicase RecQ